MRRFAGVHTAREARYWALMSAVEVDSRGNLPGPVAQPHGPANDSRFLHLSVGEGGVHDWHDRMNKVQLMLGEAEGRLVVKVLDLVRCARGCNDTHGRAAMSLMKLGPLTFPARWRTWGKQQHIGHPVDTCTVADARVVLAVAQHDKMDMLKDCTASDAVLEAIVVALVAKGCDVIASKQEEFRIAQEQFPIRVRRLQQSLKHQPSPHDAPLDETRELVSAYQVLLRFMGIACRLYGWMQARIYVCMIVSCGRSDFALAHNRELPCRVGRMRLTRGKCDACSLKRTWCKCRGSESMLWCARGLRRRSFGIR